ncbi:MAG TPA: tRNA (guanosine(37)-N1)-methyltransferase TrmD [Acidimicrobiia bacterium]|nr:tRNA (guanosine(37)-N1)-methyltransferase TrmD [Acidimicrobiia bacterium]
MKIRVVTLFPDFFDGPLRTSIVERAMSAGELEVELIDLRAFGKGVHRQVDDAPFGGGAGMVLMVEPLFSALAPIADSHRVLLTPAGTRLEQATLDRLATRNDITLVCGRYEGVDERVADHLIDEEISLGDFVVAGGEVAAATLIEGIARLLPGVVGNPESVQFESFKDGLLEEPQYTRPASFDAGDGETWDVPEILLSGDHGRIEAWRAEQRLHRTKARRPDLM